MNDNESRRQSEEIKDVTDRNADNGSDNKKYTAASELFDYLEIFVFSVTAVMLLFTFALRLCRVDGDSMQRTLFEDEVLIVSDVVYSPETDDIIVFHLTGSTDNKPIVKRVIATAWHYIKIDYDAGVVWVSEDNVFDETDIVDESPYIFLDNGRWNMSGIHETYVPEGYIFVMGDNRNNSWDSRYSGIGLVDVRRVIGKVLIRVLPFTKAGSVY